MSILFIFLIGKLHVLKQIFRVFKGFFCFFQVTYLHIKITNELIELRKDEFVRVLHKEDSGDGLLKLTD